MRHPEIMTALVLLVTASAFAGGHRQLQSSLPDGTIYIYEVNTDSRDFWDPTIDENPPLSAGGAITEARIHMERIPLPDYAEAWELSDITLESVATDENHWVYIVRFQGRPDPESMSSHPALSWFAILVRLDGTVPEPEVI
jgi:hypothetical protein